MLQLRLDQLLTFIVRIALYDIGWDHQKIEC